MGARTPEHCVGLIGVAHYTSDIAFALHEDHLDHGQCSPLKLQVLLIHVDLIVSPTCARYGSHMHSILAAYWSALAFTLAVCTYRYLNFNLK